MLVLDITTFQNGLNYQQFFTLQPIKPTKCVTDFISMLFVRFQLNGVKKEPNYREFGLVLLSCISRTRPILFGGLRYTK